MKTPFEVDTAIEKFTMQIHEAAELSSPTVANSFKSSVHVSAEIRALIREKRQLRRQWQRNRIPANKTLLNKTTVNLKHKLQEYKNETVSDYIKS